MDIQFDMGIVTTVVFIATILFVLTLALFGRAAYQQRVNARMARLRSRRGQTRSQNEVMIRRNGNNGFLDDILGKYLPHPNELRRRLRQTGVKISLGAYVGSMFLLSILFSLMFQFSFNFAPMVAILCGLFFGIMVPYQLVKRLATRRIDKFVKLFPDAIDLMVRGLRSGLPITESMATAGQEVPNPVGSEFAEVLSKVQLGKSLDDALWETSEKLDTPEFNFFVIALSIQRETGGNLAETLDNLSEILRKRAQMRLKVKAMSSEARASAVIIGSLPFIMFGIISLVNFDYISKLFNDPRGVLMVGFALVLMGMGIFVISKMVRFEI